MNIEVGKPFLPVAGRGEGAIFEADESGYLLIYNFSAPTKHEIEQTKSQHPFEIAFTWSNGLLWILSKCGDLSWADSPYHPALSPNVDKLIKPDDDLGTALTLVMTDARTSVVQSVRLVGLGHGFSVKLYDAIAELASKDFDLQAYSSALRGTMVAYTTRDLLSRSVARWKLRA